MRRVLNPDTSSIASLRILGAVTALLFVTMAIQAAPLEPSIPTIQFSFSEASFNSVLAQWRPSGVERFKWHFAIDFPFLVSYGLFGYALSRYLSFMPGRSPLTAALSSSALPVAAVMDAAENLLHLGFIYAAITIPPALYFVAGVLATFKWTLIAVFVIGACYASIRKSG